MLAVALTGSIGTGKSVVREFFKEFGAKVVNADVIANHITETDKAVIAKIKSRFGNEIYDSEGHLHRRRLGQIVFSKDEARRALNRIVHPVLAKAIDHEIWKTKHSKTHRLLIVEAALIYEIGMEKKFDYVVIVNSPIETVIQRIIKRDGLIRKEVLDRIQAQISQKDKMKRADYVLHNNGDLNSLKHQVRQLYDWLISKDSSVNRSGFLP